MKKSSFLLFFLIFTLLLSVGVHADMGPKPSVRISFLGMGEELCYGTLLSKEDRSGPARVWSGAEKDARHDQNPECMIYDPAPYEPWKAYVDYKDADGFYFLQTVWQVNETAELNWTYYPPDTFKILLYYPESDTFAVSGICERDAFHSYYTVDLRDFAISSVVYEAEKSKAESKKDEDWWAQVDAENPIADAPETEEEPLIEPDLNVQDDPQVDIESVKKTPAALELGSFLIRMVLTVLMELALALLFGYRGKKQLLLISGANIGTQILLNLGLYFGYQQVNHLIYLYLFLEILVFALEALLYILYLKEQKPIRAVVYALCANGLSFGAGLLIAEWLPYLF